MEEDIEEKGGSRITGLLSNIFGAFSKEE